MDRHWIKLEYPAVLRRLAECTDFSGGRALALELEPAPDYREARERLALTREARVMLTTHPDFSLSGIYDIRPLVAQAARGLTLQSEDLLTVRETLIGAGRVHRSLSRLDVSFPGLADIAWRVQESPALVEAIGRVLDERGEVRDSASPELSRIRSELRINLERVQTRLRRMISSELAPYLQEALITRRDGRFVIPVKSDYKGQVHGIVHDRSSSGVTLFIEPEAVVSMNNALRELTLAEEEEIFRLLAELTALVGDRADVITATLDALAELDLTLAKARYAIATNATEPELLPIPEFPAPPQDDNLHPGTEVRLHGARHPLLDPQKVVPVDLVMDDATHILIITGPNTGGKTVSLKTLGLLSLMAKAGLHLPVESGSRLSFFEHIYADIGDEQSIEQSLSTFSGHLTNILSFLESVDHTDLVVLDELGAGTDPAEGSALARALLEAFRQYRCTAMVATHYPELKLYAHNTPGVQNASMQFDAETLTPTYRLSIGLPGRSNAFAIARRLGIPEAVVKNAQSMLSGGELRVEDMLSDLHTLRIQAARARDEALQLRRDAESAATTLRKRLTGIEQERVELLSRVRKEAAAQMAALREELTALRRRAQTTPQHPVSAELDRVIAEAAAVEFQAPEVEPLVEPELSLIETPAPTGPLREGDTVRLLSLGAQGTLASLDGADAVVLVGPMRMRVTLAELELIQRRKAPAPEAEGMKLPPRGPSPGLQLDVRGQTVEQALERLDAYLDDAVRAALPWVRIVHGKGTGRLRQEIWRFLTGHPLVSSYEIAGPKEGGDGATVIKLTAV